MTHRTPTSGNSDQPTVEIMPTDEWPSVLAVPAPTGAASEVDPTPATSGRTEAATPDDAMGTMASEPALTGGSGGTAGSGRPIALVRDSRGRFTAKPEIPPMSAGLAQALLDADAETWRVDNAIRTARVLVAAVALDDLIRHAGGDAT